MIKEMNSLYKALQRATGLFDQQEICQLLNISKRTLQQYRDDGLIPFIMLERKILFRESDIIEILEDSYQGYFSTNLTEWGFFFCNFAICK